MLAHSRKTLNHELSKVFLEHARNAVGDPGEGPGGPGPPLFFDQNEARRAVKKFLGDRHPPPSLSQGFDDGPPNLKFWIRHWNVARIYSGLGYDHRFINKQMLALEKKQKQFDVQTPPPPLTRKIRVFY